MTFSPEQIAELQAPLDRKHVKSRSQAGRQLSYVEGWHAIAEANRIFGFDGWDRETLELKQLGSDTPAEIGREKVPGWRVSYMARVRICVYGGSVTREGCGYGSGIDRDLGSAHESALKEAETDAMKRALMTFGNPFGLALYDKDQANVVDSPKTDNVRTISDRARAKRPDEDVPHVETKDIAPLDASQTLFVAQLRRDLNACRNKGEAGKTWRAFKEDSAKVIPPDSPTFTLCKSIFAEMYQMLPPDPDQNILQAG